MLWSILALAQAVFLPGRLAMRVLRIEPGSMIESAILTFALSWTANYLLAAGPSALGL